MSDRDRERIIYSEGREACRIYVAPSAPGWEKAVGGAWLARIDNPDGEAWTRTGDTEDEAVENLMIALGRSIRDIERLVAAVSAYRKGEGDI